eukprot:7693589-Pyramimonas_sp.AAC.1
MGGGEAATFTQLVARCLEDSGQCEGGTSAEGRYFLSNFFVFQRIVDKVVPKKSKPKSTPLQGNWFS